MPIYCSLLVFALDRRPNFRITAKYLVQMHGTWFPDDLHRQKCRTTDILTEYRGSQAGQAGMLMTPRGREYHNLTS